MSTWQSREGCAHGEVAPLPLPLAPFRLARDHFGCKMRNHTMLIADLALRGLAASAMAPRSQQPLKKCSSLDIPLPNEAPSCQP